DRTRPRPVGSPPPRGAVGGGPGSHGRDPRDARHDGQPLVARGACRHRQGPGGTPVRRAVGRGRRRRAFPRRAFPRRAHGRGRRRRAPCRTGSGLRRRTSGHKRSFFRRGVLRLRLPWRAGSRRTVHPAGQNRFARRCPAPGRRRRARTRSPHPGRRRIFLHPVRPHTLRPVHQPDV
ncbi:hypothetical protein, partial [Arthrobacter sp. DR-2P]